MFITFEYRIISAKDAGILIEMKYNHKSKKLLKKKSVKEIMDHLTGIINEYIELESEQSVNISARVRQNILKLVDTERVSDISMELVGMSGDIKIATSSSISSLNEMDHTVDTFSSTPIIMSNIDIDIVEFLKKLDGAVEEVIKLLSCDSLIRFYESNQYQRMIKDEDKDRTNLTEELGI